MLLLVEVLRYIEAGVARSEGDRITPRTRSGDDRCDKVPLVKTLPFLGRMRMMRWAVFAMKHYRVINGCSPLECRGWWCR